MEQFDNVYNRVLSKCNHVNLNKVAYEQYFIEEKKGHYYIFDNNRIIGSGKNLKEAKELCDTINSGC